LAECGECGAIATRSLDDAWKFGFVVCECGIQMVVSIETLKALRARATGAQEKLERLFLIN
jgi:hypothetical protein